MNARWESCPEVITTITEATSAGDRHRGDFVAGISVKHFNGVGVATIDIRDFGKTNHLTCEIELAELVSAISLATLNTCREES